MSDGQKEDKKKFVSYIDEHGDKQEGFFWVLSTTDGLISVSTGSNIITFPVSRLLKIKEKISNEE